MSLVLFTAKFEAPSAVFNAATTAARLSLSASALVVIVVPPTSTLILSPALIAGIVGATKSTTSATAAAPVVGLVTATVSSAVPADFANVAALLHQTPSYFHGHLNSVSSTSFYCQSESVTTGVGGDQATNDL